MRFIVLRYFIGLVLVQLLTVGLLVVNNGADPQTLALRAGLPAVAIAFLAALWLRSLSRIDAERDLTRAKVAHERDREELTRAAERERADLTLAAEKDRSEVARQAERSIRREERRVGRRASVQVGLAFAATAGMGVLFVLSELVTLGLLTLTAGGGALGGYLMRWKQTRAASQAQMPIVDSVGTPQLPREVNAGELSDVPDENGVAARSSPSMSLPSPKTVSQRKSARARNAAPGRTGL